MFCFSWQYIHFRRKFYGDFNLGRACNSAKGLWTHAALIKVDVSLCDVQLVNDVSDLCTPVLVRADWAF